jgi:hypothetical protein
VFQQATPGYRPGRSALDAARVCRERCWKYNLSGEVRSWRLYRRVEMTPADIACWNNPKVPGG